MTEKDKFDLKEMEEILGDVFRTESLEEFAKFLKSKKAKHLLFETWYQYIEQIALSPNSNVVNRAIQQLCNFALTYKIENLILIANAHNDLEHKDFADTNICWDNDTQDLRLMDIEKKKMLIRSLAKKLEVNLDLW